jgi:hypothetical protein
MKSKWGTKVVLFEREGMERERIHSFINQKARKKIDEKI